MSKAKTKSDKLFDKLDNMVAKLAKKNSLGHPVVQIDESKLYDLTDLARRAELARMSEKLDAMAANVP